MPKHVYGVIKDKEDKRDYLFSNYIKSSDLPTSVDLRNERMPETYQQANQGSCTGQGGTCVREYILGDKTKKLSRQFLYNVERLIEGSFPEDSGAQMRTICKTLNKVGICEEEYLPYGIENIAVIPSEKAYDNASQYKIEAYYRITTRVTTIDDMKQALAQGYLILLGMVVLTSFEERVGDDGFIPMPNFDTEQELGGHCVVLCGFKDNTTKPCIIKRLFNMVTGKKQSKGFFVLRNSWGEKSASNGGWGDCGYGYLPYEVLEKIMMDAWVITK